MIVITEKIMKRPVYSDMKQAYCNFCQF